MKTLIVLKKKVLSCGPMNLLLYCSLTLVNQVVYGMSCNVFNMFSNKFYMYIIFIPYISSNIFNNYSFYLYRKTNMDKITSELLALNVVFEMRRLSVGDFAWICRDKNGRELMLPYILERKRLDDLSGSIQDGRFHEQKVNTFIVVTINHN